MATGTTALPYPLTRAQQRVLAEILEDMEAPVPMLRLLQGDVGSGKTAVIFLAALAAISSGHQVAILVPNDVLATQHDTFIRKVSQSMPEEHQPVVEVLAGRVGVKCVPSLPQLHSCTLIMHVLSVSANMYIADSCHYTNLDKHVPAPGLLFPHKWSEY